MKPARAGWLESRRLLLKPSHRPLSRGSPCLSLPGSSAGGNSLALLCSRVSLLHIRNYVTTALYARATHARFSRNYVAFPCLASCRAPFLCMDDNKNAPEPRFEFLAATESERVAGGCRGTPKDRSPEIPGTHRSPKFEVRCSALPMTACYHTCGVTGLSRDDHTCHL